MKTPQQKQELIKEIETVLPKLNEEQLERLRQCCDLISIPPYHQHRQEKLALLHQLTAFRYREIYNCEIGFFFDDVIHTLFRFDGETAFVISFLSVGKTSERST